MGIRAYIPNGVSSVKIISRPYNSKEGRHFVDYFAEIALNEGGKIELKAYLDEARGMYYVSSDISENNDFTKAFSPQIVSVAACFTMTENLEKGVKRELGWYKDGDSEALIEVYKYSKELLHVEIEGKTLAGINRLWGAIREGSILPHRIAIGTSEQPAVYTSELSQSVSDLRKKLDLANDELTRAGRVIDSFNSAYAEWQRTSSEREKFIAGLQQQLQTIQNNG